MHGGKSIVSLGIARGELVTDQLTRVNRVRFEKLIFEISSDFSKLLVMVDVCCC